MYIRSSF